MTPNGLVKMTLAVTLCLMARGGKAAQVADSQNVADRQNDDNGGVGCRQLPSHAALRAALVAAQRQSNGGFGLNMWGTL